jgi:hypothetical protein
LLYLGRTDSFRLPLENTKGRGLLAHRKPRNNPQGESELSPWDFPGFPRMLCIRAGRFQRPGQKHKVVKHGYFPKQQRENVRSLRQAISAGAGSREIISLVGVWGGQPQGSNLFLASR